MPNILTHNLFAAEVQKELTDEKLREIIKAYPKEYTIGASGPDFFFYYDVFPWQNGKENKRVAGIGGIVHSENINIFYEKAITLCYKQEATALKEAMISFLAGHFCHWALDSSAHPYIFNRTNGTTKETRYWHYRFESMIDTMMVLEIRKEELSNYPTVKMMEYDEHSVKAITAIYQPLLQEIWGIEVDGSLIEKCLHDFRAANRILFNPPLPLFYLGQGLETLLGKKWLFTSHMIIKKVDYKHDILNLNHNWWCNPCDQSMVSKASFLDLYALGKQEVLVILNQLTDAINQRDSSEIVGLLANRSYETGLSEKKVMKYYNSIY